MNRLTAATLWTLLQAVGLWLLPLLAGRGMPLEAVATAGLATIQAGLAIGLGLVLLHLTKCPFRSSLAEGGLACFLGAGTLSLAVLLLGLAGLCGELGLRLLATVGVVVVSPLTAGWLGRFRRHIRPLATELPAVGVGGLLLVLLMLHASAPPMAFDVLEYHLAAPQIWLRAGAIFPIEGNFFSHQPFLAEMNFLLGLALGTGELTSIPAWLNLWGLLAVLSLVLALGDINGIGRGVRGAAALLVLATPLIFRICTDALVDIWMVLGVVSSVYAWHRWIITRRIGALLIAALAVGFLATVKLPALAIWVVPLVVFFLYTLIAHRLCPPEWIISFVVLSAVAAVPVVPWAIKEWWWSGNPAFPLAYRLLGGVGWSPIQDALLVAGHGLRIPLTVDFWLDLWHRRDNLGPCPLSLSLGAILLAWRRRPQGLIGSVLVMVLGAGLIWNLLGHSPDRFIAPAIALLAPLGFGGLWTCVVLARRRWGRSSARWGILAVLLPLFEMAWAFEFRSLFEFEVLIVAACAVVAIAVFAKRSEPSTVACLGALVPAGMLAAMILSSEVVSGDSAGARLAHILGLRSRLEMQRGLPHVAVYTWLNEIERPAGSVFLVYESRTFGLDAPAIFGTVFDGQPLREIVRGAESNDEVLARLRAAGISHVVVNLHELQRLRAFYFGGAMDDSGLDPANGRALWDFPLPLSDSEFQRVLGFHQWVQEHAAMAVGRVTVARL